METFWWICWMIVSIIGISYGFGIAFFFTLGKALGGRKMGSGQLIGVVIILVAAYSFGMAIHLAPFHS